MGLCAGEKVYFCMGTGRPNRVKLGGPGRSLSPARPWRRDVPLRGVGGECRGGRGLEGGLVMVSPAPVTSGQ